MLKLIDKKISRILHSKYCAPKTYVKVTKSATTCMNIFQKKSFLFKSFVKIELKYAFTINLFTTDENCMEKWIIL